MIHELINERRECCKRCTPDTHGLGTATVRKDRTSCAAGIYAVIHIMFSSICLNDTL